MRWWRTVVIILAVGITVGLLVALIPTSFWARVLLNAVFTLILLAPLFAHYWHGLEQAQKLLSRFRALIEHMPDAIFVKDGHGRWLEVNRIGRALFQLEGLPWQGKTEQELASMQSELAEAHLACAASDELAWQNGFAMQTVETLRDPQGRTHHFDVIKTPFFDADGSRQTLVIVGRDITERLQAEQDLLLAASVFENSHEGIMIISAEAEPRIERVNQAFCDITGYDRSEVIGQNPRMLQSGRQDGLFYRRMWDKLLKQGNWSGEIWSRRKNGEIFPEFLSISTLKDDADHPTHYVAIFRDISEIKSAQEKLEEMANHDPLTGLPNRRLLHELLEHAIRRANRERSKIATLFIDLDRFKIVNDTLGHQVGDQLLAQVSERISDAIRDSDVLARLGGDEFVAIMDSLGDPADAAAVARKIIDRVSQAFFVLGHEIYLGASIGISFYPEDGREAADLIKAADIAMYQVKHTERNSFCFYSDTLQADRQERFMLENELRHALERGQLELYYQPQIRLSTQRIVGAEALVRWRHPEHGLISPDRFIPMAEETGLILAIGEWVLREAARQAKIWATKGYGLEWVAVNVSGVQILRSQFSDTLLGVLVESECDPGLLELEITESTVMHNIEHVAGIIAGLKNLGVRLAIDDFGTGYSSLSHLKRLALDKLKIDKSFVNGLPKDMHDAAISRAIVALGHSLEMTLIAEGVENEDQVRFLHDIGCEEVQGYHFGRPMPAQEFERLLKGEP